MEREVVVKLRQEAIELYAQKSVERAMVLFKQAAKLGDMLSMIHIALHLMQAKNYKEAKKRLNMVINAHTNALMVDVEFIQAAGEAHYLMGSIDFEQGRLRPATNSWKQAIELGNYKACYQMGLLAYRGKLSRVPELKLALEYWRIGAEQGFEACQEAYQMHRNEGIEADLYEGEQDDQGLPHGKGVMHYARTAFIPWLGYQVAPLRYEGEWSHGTRCGEGEMLYIIDGEYTSMRYRGEWQNNLPEGSGRVEVLHDDGSRDEFDNRWVAGLREGDGVELRDGVRIECPWHEDKKCGEGMLTQPDGMQFWGVWADDKLDRSRWFLKGEPGTLSLQITLRHSGFDYNRTATLLLIAAEGNFTLSDAVPYRVDDRFNDTEPLIHILRVEGKTIDYCVDGIYANDDNAIYGSISAGEEREHSSSIEGSATIYDEEYEYTIDRQIEIKCR